MKLPKLLAARKGFWEKEKEPDFSLARCYFESRVHSRSLENEKLKRRRKLPRLATFESLFLPKLMRESSALPAKGRKSNRPSDDAQQSSPAAEMSSDFSGRQASAFYTCLAIPVEGATPIQDQEIQQKSTASQSTTTPKRAPRKSKTDALAAMQIQANSSDDKSQSSYQVTGVRTFDDPGPPITISPALDMDSVKTTTSRSPLQRKHPRPFGLEDCPTYYPTMEEFKDPLGYIRSISDHAKNYGICKIVPPESWNMPFTTDTEVSSSATFSRRTRWFMSFLDPQTFRFKTRLQCLNSIEASSRAKVNFLEQLYRFHKQQGNPRVSVPTINNKSLDLWLLRKEVHKLGGYDAVRRSTSYLPPSSLTHFQGQQRQEVGGPRSPPWLFRYPRPLDSDQELLHQSHPPIRTLL